MKSDSATHLDLDAESLAGKLRRKLKGEVRFDDGSRALYATDSSNYRQTPIGVVLPRDEEDVEETLALCREFGAPITSRGGGTSLAGQCCNISVIIDFSKYMNRILEIHPTKKFARVQPGVIFDTFRDEARKHGLTFGCDTSTHRWCTLGGMIGNNSCGVHSVMAQFESDGGRTSDNVHELEILTYSGARMRVGKTSESEFAEIISHGGYRGEIYRKLKNIRDRYADLIRERYPNIPRRVSGYNLDDLLPERGFNVARALTGSEGTCVTILNATLHLIHNPPVRTLLVLGYRDVYEAGDHTPHVLEFHPTGLEGIDDVLIDDMRRKCLHVDNLGLLPEGNGWLLVEFGGDTKGDANNNAQKLMRALKGKPGAPSMCLLDDPKDSQKIWEIRESSLGATAHLGGSEDAWEGWEDSAVAPEKLGDYLRDFRSTLDRFGYGCTLYGHFGQGCVHTRIDFGLKNADGIRKYRQFVEEMAYLVVSYGGSLSGEHGDGQSRAELLPKMFGDELVRAFQEFKGVWDPDNKMNPHKVVYPYRVDENLRYGTDYNPPQLETFFKYPEDKGSFAYAMERCVGVGKCRRHEGGTMCPSYQVTHEEMHTTRGRARLFWEMLNGGVISKPWKSDAVRDSLELCLACKGCKADCPVNVDMATYKAEFLSHFYKWKLRPRAAYAMGFIFRWARMASLMPRVVNFFTQTRPFSDVMKWLGGIAPEREMPKFATETFRHWFCNSRRESALTSLPHREEKNQSRLTSAATRKRRVLLWVDTFTDHFYPNVGKSAVAVLEAAGFHVAIPKKKLCCGRPLYDFGMLKTAKALLGEIMEALCDDIEAGTAIVGLEPSCIAVFRDELNGLFPMHEHAKRLGANVFTLSEFLQKEAPDFAIPQLHNKAIVQGHCHHKAIMKMASEEKIYEQLGLDFELLDAGCCGMAGSFGFEKGEKYDVSVKCGERALLPKVRSAADETLIIADGFSCREQISQLSERQPMHTAELLEKALREGTAPKRQPRRKATPRVTKHPTKHFAETHTNHSSSKLKLAAMGAVGILAGLILSRTKLDD
jgi:FAD/FMN-containing dehydrogenase/Fe-S oxidoreductase